MVIKIILISIILVAVVAIGMRIMKTIFDKE